MAVQKNKVSRARRGNRRSHDGLSGPALSIDSETGEVHRRHHMTKSGSYRNRQILSAPAVEESPEQDA